MNPNIKAVIGEADMHSPTERAVLDREAATNPGKPAGKTLKLSGNMLTIPFDPETGDSSPDEDGESHAEGMDSPEEAKEVQLANQILAAVKSGDMQGASAAANELIRMHGKGASGSHVQPVPHPQMPRAGDFGMHSGGV